MQTKLFGGDAMGKQYIQRGNSKKPLKTFGKGLSTKSKHLTIHSKDLHLLVFDFFSQY